MRIPISWLRDYVAMDMPLDELASRLSVTTAEIEDIEARGVADEDGNLGLFRIGKVIEAEKHPNADRLQITKVDVGEAEPRSIVCGAWNFGVGATVAVALPGARLPNGLELDRREVRGEISDGMILAEDEVGLGGEHAGIMLLPATEPGTPLADVLPLVDHVLLVEATGNRPDLQSVYGLAREIATLYDLPLRDVAGDSPRPRPEQTVEIRIDDFDGCPRYVGHLFENVAIGPSPQWLRTRLFLAGQRPISNVVDITNYVMFALGNPLHAFDFTTLHGGQIVVRRAAAGREADDARRRRPRPRPRGPRDRRRRPRDRARRDHGRRGHRDRRGHDDRPARGRELRAVPASTAPRSASGSAPRARTAGRRASTPTLPARPPRLRPRSSCS